MNPWAIAAVCVGGYTFMALLAVRVFPLVSSREQLLSRLRRVFPFRTAHIAHRGGSLIGPENTIYTFQRGLQEFGVDLLELDVHESKDGVAVVIHDRDLSRICDPQHQNYRPVIDQVVVGESPEESMPKTKKKIELHFRSEAATHYEELLHCPTRPPCHQEERLCTLREVFEHFPDTPMHVDIKHLGKETLVRNVVSLVEEFKRAHITIVGSASTRNRKSIDKIEKECRAQKTKRFASANQILWTVVLYHVGLLPLFPLSYDVFSIPLPTDRFRNFLTKSSAREHPILAYFAFWLMKSPALWENLQRRNILVLGWVINDADAMVEAAKWPINGIMTDDPKLLQEFYAEHDTSAMNLL